MGSMHSHTAKPYEPSDLDKTHQIKCTIQEVLYVWGIDGDLTEEGKPFTLDGFVTLDTQYGRRAKLYISRDVEHIQKGSPKMKGAKGTAVPDKIVTVTELQTLWVPLHKPIERKLNELKEEDDFPYTDCCIAMHHFNGSDGKVGKYYTIEAEPSIADTDLDPLADLDEHSF